MSFSKEDKAAWLDSEVMKELEKIAQDENILDGPAPEAFEPIPLGKEAQVEEEGEEEVWEEEGAMERFDDALAEFKEPTIEKELRTAYDKLLLENLAKISSTLADNKNIKAAYRVETTLNELHDLFKEGE